MAKMNNRPKDAIKIIHKRLQNGFHRFGEPDRVRTNWSELFTLLRKEPSYVTYLDDQGEGDAPEIYLIVVEKCLRKVALDSTLSKYAMGKFAMISYLEWINTPYWYKREAYIAFVRTFQGLPSYRKYIAYDWADKVSRRAMAKTFFVRHRQYTNGDRRLPIPDPRSWSQGLSRRRKPRVPAATNNSDDDDDGLTASAGPQKNYNSDTDMWDD